MAKNRAAWWWIDRWRKSTAYTDMSLAEQGAYRNLLDELWLRGGMLPNDERILAKICGDAVAWPSVRGAVLSRFVASPAGLRNETHDEVSAYPNIQAERGKKRAQAARREKGRFAPAGPAGHQPNDQPNDQPEPPAEHQPPYSVLRTPSPLPEQSQKDGQNGRRPCDHAHARKRFAETGRTTICSCGEELRSVTANPFIPDRAAREALERESLRLTGEIAEITGEDPADVFAHAANYDGAKRQKLNPATMGDDRLLATVRDLKANLKAAQAKRKPVSA